MAPLPKETQDTLIAADSRHWKLNSNNDDVSAWWADENNNIKRKETVKLHYYELNYNNTALKFTVEIFNSAPRGGYPLFIALHGGGGAAIEINNGAWYDMSTGLYRDTVQNIDSIYVAVRGVTIQGTDYWDLFFRPETFVLLERLIKSLIVALPGVDRRPGQPLVNPNRVYLTGFSAGGDGVYRLSTGLSDLFAAVNMSAGHPGSVQFENLANLPICLQCGQSDTDFSRDQKTIESAKKLNELKGSTSLYEHQCYMHKNGSHNSWEWAECGEGQSDVLNQYTCPPLVAADGANTDATSMNTNAIAWMQPSTRNPVPPQVVWNFASQPPPPKNADDTVVADWKDKKFFYWLYLRDPSTTHTDIVRASYNKSENLVSIEEPNNYVGLLLNNRMVDFSAPVKVQIGKTGDNVTQLNISPSAQIQTQTLMARKDSNFVFSAMIVFDSETKGNWVAKAVTSLSSGI
jgi:hypothetical protein